MARRVFIALTAAITVAVWTNNLAAQDLLAQSFQRGPGGYLAWWKLLSIGVMFLVWVKMTDWINVDAMKIGESTGMQPEVWNMISVCSLLVGFWSVISVPIFWVGMPVYFFSIFTPWFIYSMSRRGKFKDNPRLKMKLELEPGEPDFDPLPQEEGAPVEFTAAGEGSDQQANQIRARQTTGYTVLKDLVFDGVDRRAETVMLDYTRDQVGGQMMIDGSWHPLPVLDRETGDAMLISVKFLAGLNARERRERQLGRIATIVGDERLTLEVLTQGVNTGERVQIKFIQNKKVEFSLTQLGMWPEMVRRVSLILQQPGLVIVAAPPRHGLTATWRATLAAGDRITRDWVGIMDVADDETEIENITANRFDASKGESPSTMLKQILLRQPEAIVVPNLMNSQTLDAMCEQVINEKRTVVTQIQAKSAAEAILRLYALAGDKKMFSQALSLATCQRLARRLCETCKQPVVVQPQLIKKLGGDPQRQNTVFNPFQMPPPGTLDAEGNPLEIEPCETCAAIGFIGRIGIFETIVANDQIRTAVFKQPQVPIIQNVATKTGNESIHANGYKLALMGITSVNEVQRVLKS